MMRSFFLPVLGLGFGLALVTGCGKKADPAATDTTTTTSASAPDAKTYHCKKASLGRCEQTTADRLAAAKAKMEAGTETEKKLAGFMTVEGFKSMCGKGEYGEGPCESADLVGACAGDAAKTLYYGGANGYKATDFAFECKGTETPEGADGKPMPKPAPTRMSCFRSKTNTCVEADFKGKTSLIGFCQESSFDGPAELAMKPCPTEKRTGACKDGPITFEGKTIEATRVTYSYGAKADAKNQSICKMMKGAWSKG